METAKDILQFYSDNPSKWWYYSTASLCLDGVLTDPRKALSFIESYFDIAGKSTPFTRGYIVQNRNDLLERSIHIVSTFFLGLKIAGCIGINTTVRNDAGISFLYYWFLACLYHDIGYVYERHSEGWDLDALATYGLDKVKKACDIKYLNKNEFQTYSKELVDVYLKGRAAGAGTDKRVIDHGIVGGLLLYDSLRRQYELSWKSAQIDVNNSHDCFYIQEYGHTLWYAKTHYREYAKAADAVIAHNIWQNTLNGYLTQNGKETLAIKKISLTNPLCFILCLADTIEPLKRNPEKGDPEFINTVSFSFENCLISIETRKNALSKVYENIEKLIDWMDVAVERSSNRITIKINESEE